MKWEGLHINIPLLKGRRERGGLGKLSAASVPEAAGLGFQDQQAVVMVTSRNSRVFRETEQVLILYFLLLSPIGQSSELTPSLNW